MIALLSSLLILHLDFNTVQMKRDAVVDHLREAARAGCNAVLWEIENKVRWETCPECVHPEAFSKAEFREILKEAERLGLEPIPLMQTFGHAEYVLQQKKYFGWREDPTCRACYCVSKPEVRAFQKALLHEYLDLFGSRVKRFHLGGDEAVVFGTCPECRKVDKMDLYVSNLMSVSEELREKGIRPGVWADMVMLGGDWKNYGRASASANVMAKLPRSFTLWNWDYAYGTAAYRSGYTQKTPFLKGLGYEVILCASTQSAGDSMFLPRYRHHRDNIAASADLVRRENLAGLCLTSWSVHLYPKRLQYPLWEFAGRRLNAPSADAEADFSAIFAKHWKVGSMAVLDDLTNWRGVYNRFDVRFRRMEKPALPAQPGELASRLKALDSRKGRASALAQAKADIPRLAAILADLKRDNAGANPALAAGGEHALAFLKGLVSVLEGRSLPEDPTPAMRRYYGLEQPPASAANSAELAWSLLKQKGIESK